MPIKTVAVAFACLSLTALPAAADLVAIVEGAVERPLPPTILTATGSDAGNMLSWDPPLTDVGAPLDVYNVYRFVNGVEESLGSISASQTSYFDGDVATDGSAAYTYYVTAESASGESLPSNLAFVDYPHCTPAGVFLGPPIDYDFNPDCLKPIPFIGPVVVVH